MESRWSVYGYLGSILLIFYGFFSLVTYHLSPALLGATGGSIITILLGVLALLGGALFSCAFHAFGTELKVSWTWVPFLMGLIIWVAQGVTQILVGLGNPIGVTSYGWMVILLLFLFLIWGFFVFMMRKQYGRKERLGLYAAILFLLNGIGWLSIFGFGILVVSMVLMAIILVPERRILPILSIREFFSAQRKISLTQLATLLLTIYAILGMKWVINIIFPLPVLAAAVLNFLSIVAIWVTIPGLILVFLNIEEDYNNPFAYYALLVGTPALLMLSLTDFTWLMSNINVFYDAAWGVQQYLTVSLIQSWASVLLLIWCLASAIAFLQISRLPITKGDNFFLIIGVLFLLSAFIWFIGGGFILLIMIGILLYWKYGFKRKTT